MVLTNFEPKSKLTKVNIAWTVIIAAGIYGFVIAKRTVDRNRMEFLRSKQRIREARQKDSEEKFGTSTSD